MRFVGVFQRPAFPRIDARKDGVIAAGSVLVGEESDPLRRGFPRRTTSSKRRTALSASWTAPIAYQGRQTVYECAERRGREEGDDGQGERGEGESSEIVRKQRLENCRRSCHRRRGRDQRCRVFRCVILRVGEMTMLISWGCRFLQQGSVLERRSGPVEGYSWTRCVGRLFARHLSPQNRTQSDQSRKYPPARIPSSSSRRWSVLIVVDLRVTLSLRNTLRPGLANIYSVISRYTSAIVAALAVIAVVLVVFGRGGFIFKSIITSALAALGGSVYVAHGIVARKLEKELQRVSLPHCYVND